MKQQQNQPIEVLLRNSRLNRNAYPERKSPHCLKASATSRADSTKPWSNKDWAVDYDWALTTMATFKALE